MTKRSPFDYVKSINEKSAYLYDLKGYNPYLTNACFSMHIDTVMLAEEMNQNFDLAPHMQYDFYYYGVRRGKRFGFPAKPVSEDNLDVVKQYYQYSDIKAKEVLPLLTQDQIAEMRKSMDTGGRT